MIQELYYSSLDSKVMVVDVTPGVAPKFGQPKALFSFGMPGPTNGPTYPWDVTPDGSRFLINVAGNETVTSAPLTLVLNWTAALK